MEDQGETFERTTHPDYSSGGLHKELADMLFILHDECMVVSIKGTDDQPKPAERLRNWLRKKTWQASKGAKAGIQRLATVTFSARNLWGETREFPAGSLKPQCGIALLECSQEPFKSIEFDVEQPACQVPIHFLSLNDFLNAVMWLGSVWDVFQYFRQRANVFSTFTGINQEQPALSYYTLRAKDFKGFPEADNNELKELHNLHLLDNLENYQERERPAGYVNAVVHELHTRFPEMESLTPPELRSFVEPRDKRSAYLKMAAMLNELPMSNKANIGRRLETMLKDLKRSGQQGCFAFKRLYGQMVYVFACFSGMSRTERMRALNQLLPASIDIRSLRVWVSLSTPMTRNQALMLSHSRPN